MLNGKPIGAATVGITLALIVQLVGVVAILVTMKVQGDQTRQTIVQIQETLIRIDEDVDDNSERIARLEGEP